MLRSCWGHWKEILAVSARLALPFGKWCVYIWNWVQLWKILPCSCKHQRTRVLLEMSGNSGKILTALAEGDGCGKRGFHYRYHLMVVLPGNNCIFLFLKAGFQSNNTTTAVRWELLCLWESHTLNDLPKRKNCATMQSEGFAQMDQIGLL